MICEAASRLAAMNSVRFERRTSPAATIGFKPVGLFDQGRGDRQAGADRGVDLVGDAGHQPSQCGQLLGLHQTVLRGSEVVERLRQLPGAILHLGEQPRILDRDHGLAGKGSQQFDLCSRETVAARAASPRSRRSRHRRAASAPPGCCDSPRSAAVRCSRRRSAHPARARRGARGVATEIRFLLASGAG